MTEWTKREQSFGHALYTCAMHAKQHGQTLILDRIRGTVGKVPSLLLAYPQLYDVLGLERKA